MAEQEVGTAGNALVATPAGDAGRTEDGREPQLGGFVAVRADGSHDLAALLLCEHIGHAWSVADCRKDVSLGCVEGAGCGTDLFAQATAGAGTVVAAVLEPLFDFAEPEEDPPAHLPGRALTVTLAGVVVGLVNLRFGRPSVLDAMRVRENWFLRHTMDGATHTNRQPGIVVPFRLGSVLLPSVSDGTPTEGNEANEERMPPFVTFVALCCVPAHRLRWPCRRTVVLAPSHRRRDKAHRPSDPRRAPAPPGRESSALCPGELHPAAAWLRCPKADQCFQTKRSCAVAVGVANSG